MALKHRIGRLEVQARGSPPAVCPACGNGLAAPLDLRIIAPETRSRIDDGVSADEQPGDRCAACRRKVVFRIPSPRLFRAVRDQGQVLDV